MLSGMNSMQMVEENIETVNHCPAGSLSGEERELVKSIRADIESKVKVGCTGCAYCMPCPKGVDIPAAFQSYNLLELNKSSEIRWKYVQQTIFRHDTTDLTRCISCGACMKKCPQHLEIPKLLKDAEKQLEPFYVKAMNKAVHVFKFY